MFDDANLPQAVLAELNSDPIVTEGQIRVTASGADRPTGSVHSPHGRELAEKTAWAAPGRAKLENLLETV